MTARGATRHALRPRCRSPSLAGLGRLLLGALALAPLPAWAADVAVLMSAKVPVYEQALRGFEQSSQHEIVAHYDMNGDPQRGRRLVREIDTQLKPDLLLAIGLRALEAAVQESPSVPVVYAMVMNPPSVVGTVAKRITGASMNVPVERALQTFKQLGAGVRRIGVVYDPKNTGFLVEEASGVAGKRNLELVAKQVRSMGDAIAAVEQMQAEGVDALWILPDKTVLAPAFVEHMLLFSYRSRIPLLGLSKRHAEMGALVSLYFASGEDIGHQAGELVNQILGGRADASIPYTSAREVNLVVNLKTARKIGVEIPESITVAASAVIQ